MRYPLPTDPEVKQRRCLSCREMFFSQHSGNRMCDDCKNRAETRGMRRGQFAYELSGRARKL